MVLPVGFPARAIFLKKDSGKSKMPFSHMKKCRHTYDADLSYSTSPSHLKKIESDEDPDEDVDRLLPFKLSLAQSPMETKRIVSQPKADSVEIPSSPSLSLYIQVINSNFLFLWQTLELTYHHDRMDGPMLLRNLLPFFHGRMLLHVLESLISCP
jgi:hypothetical protein